MSITSRVPASDLEVLNLEFKDVCQTNFFITKDMNGKERTSVANRGTFLFRDGTRLSVEEKLGDDGCINVFHYDYYDKNKVWLIKYHSEPHDRKEYQTITEPYHTHLPGDILQTTRETKRLPNYVHKDIYIILEEIRYKVMVNANIR